MPVTQAYSSETIFNDDTCEIAVLKPGNVILNVMSGDIDEADFKTQTKAMMQGVISHHCTWGIVDTTDLGNLSLNARLWMTTRYSRTDEFSQARKMLSGVVVIRSGSGFTASLIKMFVKAIGKATGLNIEQANTREESFAIIRSKGIEIAA
ncbi:MAG: hypothetical protein AAFQ98_09845 [Bacteroidota bacterium]